MALVVDLDQDASGQAQQRYRVGEHADDVGAVFDLLVDPLEWVGRPANFQCATGKSANAVVSTAATCVGP